MSRAARHLWVVLAAGMVLVAAAGTRPVGAQEPEETTTTTEAPTTTTEPPVTTTTVAPAPPELPRWQDGPYRDFVVPFCVALGFLVFAAGRASARP